MITRHYQMRLNCTYVDPDNSVDLLEVETLIDEKWQPLELNVKAPGFQIFLYALLSCQHLYFRLNAAERGLMLVSSSGSISVNTDVNWHIEMLHVEINGKLRSGSASQRDINYIVERMDHCPVSSNIKPVPDNKKVVTLN